MNGDPAARAWVARVLAPLAFFAAALVLVLVIHNSLNPDEAGSNAPTATRAATKRGGQTTTGTAQTTTRAAQAKRFYRVRSGDTLEAIASRFDTTVADLLTLNPGIDPNALTVGQRVRVR